MRRSSFSVFWLLIVFVSGTTVGIVGHRYFARDTAPHSRVERSRDDVRREYLSRLRERVGVSEEQIQQIVGVLDRARAESDARKSAFDQDMRSLQHATREQIRNILTAEQLRKYDEWREERRRQREKHEKGRGDRDGRQ